MGIAVCHNIRHNSAPFLIMNKEAKKSNEAQLLDLLKRVLPEATRDAQLAERIYQAIEGELKAEARALAFEKFCGGIELPNLEQKTVADVKLQLAASFGDGDITLKPNKKEQSLMVELALRLCNPRDSLALPRLKSDGRLISAGGRRATIKTSFEALHPRAGGED